MGLEFKYEGKTFELQPSFLCELNIKEWKGAKRVNINKIRPITYTPDFVGDSWIIETKGHRTNEFNLKWKMFKYLLNEKRKDIFICMPRNRKQVDECIKDICLLKKI